MPEPYAVHVDQKTGKRTYYKNKAAYLAGRATKQNSANRRRNRILGNGK